MGACDGCGTPEDVRQDNHIHVELDFVPVEERLPDDIHNVYGLCAVWERPEEVWYDDEVRLWRDFWRGKVVDITHWSEIPTIEGRE